MWKRLAAAGTLQDFATAWAALQCAMVPGARRAVVAAGQRADGIEIVAVWPQDADPGPSLPAIRRAVEAAKGIAQGSEGDVCQLAFPLQADGATLGAVAIEIPHGGPERVRVATRQLQWGSSWVRERLRYRQEMPAGGRVDRLSSLLDLIAVAAEEARHRAACRALVTECATRFACDRVSIGVRRRQRTRIAAISHSANFGREMNLVGLLEAAMDEATDQRAVLRHPAPPEDTSVLRAHAELARRHGAGTILTTPMVLRGDFVGAITFERPADRPFDADTIALLDGLAAAVAPILDDKRRNDRWLAEIAAAVAADQWRRLAGPRHAGRKLAVLAALALALLFEMWTDAYRITADAVIEGSVQRAIVASLNGYIRDAPVRAGDTVADGQLVVALDDRDLALERLRWMAERQRFVLQYDRALGDRNRAEARVVTSQIEEADAQIRLVDEQLARTRLLAPFRGLVVSGDLSQAIGAAVQRGQTLFEIAPLDSYRVVLQVDESQIADVAIGTAGVLTVTSLPLRALPLTVSKITPVATAREGHTFFRIEARLAEATAELRPGMTGVAKIDVAQRRVLWIWTRSLQDWIRLTLWRWLG